MGLDGLCLDCKPLTKLDAHPSTIDVCVYLYMYCIYNYVYIYIWVSINGYPNSWLVDNGKSENIMDDFGVHQF